MAKKRRKLTKEEVSHPDAFISVTDKIIEALDEFKTPIIAALGAAFLLGAGMVTVNLLKKHKENTASDAFFSIQAQIDRIKDELKDEPNKTDPPDHKKSLEKKKTQNIEKKMDRSASEFKEKFSTLAKEYESAILSHLGTSTAIYGALFLANLYGEYNMWKEANNILLKVASDLTDKHFFYGLVHTNIGTTWMELTNYEKAITSYEKVLALEKQSHLHGNALVKKGLSHEQLNQTEKARTAYEQAVKDHSKTQTGRSARAYLRYMKFKKSYKK